MPRCLPLFLALLAALLLVSPCAAQTPPPATAAKLRRLLPFPEAILRPKMEMSVGIYSVPGGKSEIRRQSSNYAAQIVQVRRTLTGSIADAPRDISLGYLYRPAGLVGKSRAAFRQTEILCQNALRRNPRNGFALAEYGNALAALGHTDDAEVSLKHAVQTAPNSADVWRALGAVLAQQVSPTAEATKHFARDASAAYAQAIMLAPHNPAVWAARGSFRTYILPQLYGASFSREGQSDYERAADLSPSNPCVQAMVPTIDYAWVEIKYSIPTSPEAAGKETPAAIRRAEIALRRITNIAQSTHGEQAAQAYAARAWVQFQFCYDPKGAQKSLHLALQQNPSQQDAIDYQMHVAAVTGDDVLLATACRRELRRRPQVYLRVLLADADCAIARQKPRYWQEARVQMEMAHAAAPQDDALRLGLAVLLLKSGIAANQSRAAVLLGETAPSAPGRSKAQQAEYDLTRGISAALAGHPAEAQTLLTSALQNDPHNQPAHSALALL